MNTEMQENLTVSEAAVLLRLSPPTVREWLKSGKLAGHKAINGQWRISRAEVDRANGQSTVAARLGETDARQ